MTSAEHETAMELSEQHIPLDHETRASQLPSGGCMGGGGDCDIDKWIEMTRGCKYLPENDLHQLCDLVLEHLVEENNVQPIASPVTVCGDIHGQYYDLQELFKCGGPPSETNYVVNSHVFF